MDIIDAMTVDGYQPSNQPDGSGGQNRTGEVNPVPPVPRGLIDKAGPDPVFPVPPRPPLGTTLMSLGSFEYTCAACATLHDRGPRGVWRRPGSRSRLVGCQRATMNGNRSDHETAHAFPSGISSEHHRPHPLGLARQGRFGAAGLLGRA